MNIILIINIKILNLCLLLFFNWFRIYICITENTC